MPIFLDRHDLKGLDATPAGIAQAYEADLATQEAYDVKVLIYETRAKRGANTE